MNENKKISQLEIATESKNTDIIPIVQDGSNKQMSKEMLLGDHYNKKEVDTKIEEVDAKFKNKADKATTLKGYGITDAYTKEEVDAKDTDINNTINATSGEQEIVEKEESKEEKGTENKKEETVKTEAKVTEEIKEPVFEKPVEGEIIKKFAKDTLVYSETLDEWVVHNGIDIKADKTTVVKAAEAGTVKAIKNDPRYGLTIVIQHDMDYITVYSNLLSTEFVVEGEKVEKGQGVGTVGNTGAFEIADEPHLHFEIQKAGEAIDPSNYIELN